MVWLNIVQLIVQGKNMHYKILMILLTFFVCNVSYGDTVVNLNVHGIIAEMPCEAVSPDISVQLEDVSITDLDIIGNKIYGADYLVPISCPSGATIALTFDGSHDTDASILNTDQSGVGMKLECNNVAVTLAVPFFAGTTAASGGDVDVPCKVYYTRKNSANIPVLGTVNASMSYIITYF